MKKLTERQNEILSFITSFLDKNGISPTLREIASHFEISPAAVHYALESMEAKGAVQLNDGSPRGIQLSARERMLRENAAIPLFEEEPTPVELEDKDAPGTCFLQKSYLEGKELFAFRVSSYSMNGAGILPGDVAIIQKSSKAKDGDIVLASALSGSEERLELRRYRRIREFEELWPENDSMGIIRSQKVRIYGILFEIRRSY